MVPDDIRPEWPYGELIATHADKLLAANVMAHMFADASSGRDMITGLAEFSENFERLAREHNQAKQRGFYADLVDGVIWEPTGVKQQAARDMVNSVRSLFQNGGPLADPGFIAWLASQDPDVMEMRDMVWGVVVAGLKQGGPEGMLASLRNLMDEIGATEGFPEMIREQAAIGAAGSPKRVQPRRLPRRQRRVHR
jgi:hypothetical protein